MERSLSSCSISRRRVHLVTSRGCYRRSVTVSSDISHFITCLCQSSKVACSIEASPLLLLTSPTLVICDLVPSLKDALQWYAWAQFGSSTTDVEGRCSSLRRSTHGESQCQSTSPSLFTLTSHPVKHASKAIGRQFASTRTVRCSKSSGRAVRSRSANIAGTYARPSRYMSDAHVHSVRKVGHIF